MTVAVAGGAVAVIVLTVLVGLGTFLIVDWVDDTKRLETWQKVAIISLTVTLVVSISFCMAVVWYIFMIGAMA